MEDITKYKFSDPNHDATEVDGERCVAVFK